MLITSIYIIDYDKNNMETILSNAPKKYHR